MNIAGHTLTHGRVFVIAELGVNHDGSLDTALAMVDAAADAGADAIKTQYFKADRLLSRAAVLTAYQRSAGEADPAKMFARLELTLDDHENILDRAHARGLAGIVTIFSAEHVNAAQHTGCDAFKSASPDIVNKPLLDALMATGLPLLLSTGAATLDEVTRTITWLKSDQAQNRTALMQCVSAYPVPQSEMALDGIGALAHIFEGPVGYSDHTTEVDTGALAVSKGAVVLEKHMTLDRTAQGPDHAASLEPDDLRTYIAAARHTASAAKLTPAAQSHIESKYVLDCEREARQLSRQSVVSAKPIASGSIVRADDLTIKRPGTGIGPWRLGEVIGRRAARNIEYDMPIDEEDLA